jgi:hypothetical protein
VVGMGAALELGKPSAVAWLGRHGRNVTPVEGRARCPGGRPDGAQRHRRLGFLAKAHIASAVAGEFGFVGACTRKK